MAKASKTSKSANVKLNFGKRKAGKYKKSTGPKEKAVKAKYRGQGR